MPWIIAAEGTSFWDLKETIADMELTKGTRMKVIMDTKISIGAAFDFIGAEWLMKPFIPDGMELIDVYGEGGQGIVELEADPVWLLAVLAFIKAHWLALVIAGFTLAAIISSIYIMIKIPAIAQIPFALLIGVAAGIVGLTILARKAPT